MSIAEIAELIKVDSLGFLTIDGLYRAVAAARRDPEFPQFCDACFTGDYPIRLTDQEEQTNVRQLSLLAEAS
jgi:amidophosphoribosyltransferase